MSGGPECLTNQSEYRECLTDQSEWSYSVFAYPTFLSPEGSLKSSRRRPVSVDFEPGVVRTPSAPRTGDRRTVGGGEHVDRSGGGGGGGGARPETGEGTGKGGAGNRNSHTLTERDVEIGFQKMEKHNGE